MKILAVSDEALDRIYALASSGHFKQVELIIGCGDLPYHYLEYLVTILNVPMFYVPGNHDPNENLSKRETKAEGGSNLDLKLVRHNRFLIGGFGGSVRYRPDGTNQYSQTEAYLRAFRLIPKLLFNRLQYGRALDILISHSPPFGVHDDVDPAHIGLKALNWLIRFAQPRYLLHGHTHLYMKNLAQSETVVNLTKITNVYPYKVIDLTH
ncbi:MAG: metallophosphoesterase [Anaerolineales bacterium]|nr:metallophosphoesterase [Anaerolineales bacterium]